ncbi:MAG TPA: lysylphosphatidylglycerol synthase domain-containing protein, partial [Acidimicrobiia bacterium]|nr:lysylphosphatidylglycerol synthase domain-containing protein [Acidimicrobiia bacterium]
MDLHRRTLARPVRSMGMLLAVALLVEYVVFPQLAGARQALHLLGDVNAGLLGLAFLFEGGALLAYAALTSSLLPPDSRPTRWTVLRINLATLAVSHVVPGGSAAAGAVGFDLLGDAGVSRPDAGFALATQALGSAVVLNVLLWAGLVVSIPTRGFNPLYATAALIGAVLIGAVATAVVLLTRGEDRAARLLYAVSARVPLLNAGLVEQAVHRVAVRLRTLTGDRDLLSRAAMWATANWVADLAALWLSLAAFGYHARPDSLIVAYGLANVTAAIPVTPGGLGVME